MDPLHKTKALISINIEIWKLEINEKYSKSAKNSKYKDDCDAAILLHITTFTIYFNLHFTSYLISKYNFVRNNTYFYVEEYAICRGKIFKE